MKRSTEPSRCAMAKPSGSGVCGTSPPRMLSSQAIELGAVSTAASTASLASAAAISRRFWAASLPAKRRSCGTTGAKGAGGWSVHTASMGLRSSGASAAAGALGRGAEALDLARRVQPRIVAERSAARQIGGDPFAGRLLGDMAALVERAIDLRLGLERVAAIDEDRRPLRQHDGEPRRAGEAGEPGEALAARRHVFALMLVGARHEEALHAAPREFRAQPRRALSAAAPGGNLSAGAAALSDAASAASCCFNSGDGSGAASTIHASGGEVGGAASTPATRLRASAAP